MSLMSTFFPGVSFNAHCQTFPWYLCRGNLASAFHEPDPRMAKKAIDGKIGLRTSKIKRSIKETRGREDKLGKLIFPLRFKFLCLNQPNNCSVNIRQVQGDVAIPRVRFMKGRGQVAPAQLSWKSLAMSIEGSPREESWHQSHYRGLGPSGPI